jgi:hypothetical protein
MILAAIAAVGAMAAEIPAGTPVSVRVGQTISSKNAKSGDPWVGTLAADLAIDGNVIAKRGAPIQGIVVSAKESGRISGVADLQLQLTGITIDEKMQPVVTASVGQEGAGHAKRNGVLVGGGAALGAIIGAAAGGGKGAAIGAGAGAATGAGGAAATGKKDVAFPVETVLTFTVK